MSKRIEIMTRKQMKKLAKEIYECELIHQNESSSKEEKTRAEDRIMQISNQVMMLHDGMNTMLQIDEIVQDLLLKEK